MALPGAEPALPGSGASNVAQKCGLDLQHAERGLSSFNQTHKFTADYSWELPFGHDRRWLRENTPATRPSAGDWQWSGDWTFASGLPFTPRFQGNVADVNRGTNGTLRPNVIPGQSIGLGSPSIAEWFNTAAFSPNPTVALRRRAAHQHYWPRNQGVRHMAFTKMFPPLKESRVLELRAQATNMFNIPNYSSIDTSVTSPTFGRVTAVGAMRQITVTARFRF